MNSEIKKLTIIALFLGRHNLPGLSVVSALLTRQRLSETQQPGCRNAAGENRLRQTLPGSAKREHPGNPAGWNAFGSHWKISELTLS